MRGDKKKEKKQAVETRVQPLPAQREKPFFFAPVEQHVGLRVLHHRLVDLRHVLIVKLVPLAVDDVLAVGDVVATCVESGGQTR